MGTIVNGILYNDEMTRISDGSNAVGDIVIPAGVTSIKRTAFQGSEISSVIFPDSLNFIDSFAFEDCKKLKRVVFGKGIRDISEGTFRRCFSLEEVQFSDNIEEIWNFAFAGCKKLSDITFGKNLVLIGVGAFLQTAIEKITIPSSVKYLADSCLYTPNLQEVIFEKFEPYYIDAISTSMCERPDKDEWPKESYMIKLLYDDKIKYMPKFIYEYESIAYSTPLYTLADSDTLQYATAIKEYEYTKDKAIKEFLIKNSVEIAKLMLQSGKEEAFFRFLKLDIIPDSAISDILAITEALNNTTASAYLLNNSKNFVTKNNFCL